MVCANVRGLNSNDKKTMLLKELKQRDVDIAVITNTRISETDVNILRQDEDYICIYTEKPNTIIPCCGVIIMWKKKSLITIEHLSDRADGNSANCQGYVLQSYNLALWTLWTQ